MTEPFPAIDEDIILSSHEANSPTTPSRRQEAHSDASTLSNRIRSASKRFNESSLPLGFMAATGEVASSLPLINDFRRGTYTDEGWSGEGQIIEKERRASLARPSAQSLSAQRVQQDSFSQPINENGVTHHQDNTNNREDLAENGGRDSGISSNVASRKQNRAALTEPYPNGYEFPPKHTWKESSVTFLRASWKFVTTPLGFLITIYGLNVVAWGGMLFLLLCNASPAMCHPSCGDINSPRRIWIEIDSQILNALFCVTGFGLIPWRFRDFYHLLNYRINKTQEGLTRLAGIHRDWFRLQGSQDLPVNIGPSNIDEHIANVPLSSIPYPPKSIPDAPLTGIRASPTPLWKLDFVVWAFVLNTCLQVVLSGFMWGFNRQKRPSWSTGLFVALACIIAAAGGYMIFIEGKRVKGIEGVPVSEKDKERLRRDREMGIIHFNNISSAPPKEKKAKAKKELDAKKDEEAGHEMESVRVDDDENTP